MGVTLLLAGCRSNPAVPDAESAEESEAPEPSTMTAVPPPAGSPLSNLTKDMSPEQVQQIMGSPSSQVIYPTSKTFNTSDFGNDSGNRVQYKYKGQGRVIFAVPKRGGSMKVLRVDYDPSEDGN